MLLQLLHRVLPSGVKLAESYYQARKLTENLGFTYETLDACPNNCMLFRNENAHLDTCIVCQTSRWKEDGVGCNRQNSSTSVLNRGKCVAAKQVRYFPLKPRLNRLLMSSKISKLMRWHAENNRDDGHTSMSSNGTCLMLQRIKFISSIIGHFTNGSRITCLTYEEPTILI
ncbi:hypothetical protein AAC387_Pa04g1620 [Persea americana]